jgi:hypothetical protein
MSSDTPVPLPGYLADNLLRPVVQIISEAQFDDRYHQVPRNFVPIICSTLRFTNKTFNFNFMTGVNTFSAICWYLFYLPLAFKMLHRRKAAKDLFVTFDWIGLAMYTGSLTILIMGLNWGRDL